MIINIESEKRKMLEEVRMETPGYEALNKLKIIRENIDWAIEGYRNSLTILSDTTYEDRKHFLLELIQNADDADYGKNHPEITFTITSEGLELFYNEVGFTIEDIISITDTGASTKKSKKNSSTSFIGEKGIGFKSVFALAETVEIQSGPWHFLLEKDRCIVPTPVGEKGQNLAGTKQIIKFLDAKVIDEIYDELKRYVSGEVESFLYLQKISRFTLVDKRDAIYEKHEIEILPSDRSGDKLTLKVVNTGEEREFLLYSENVTFSKELVASRWEKIGTSMGSVERKVTLAAIVKGERKEQNGRLFCYLPTSVKLPIPVFMQIDGMTKADRERLHDPYNNEWNKYLLSKLPEIIARAIVRWSEIMKSPELFHQFIPTADGEDQLYYVFRDVRKLLKNYQWIKVMADENSWEKPGFVVEVPSYLRKILTRFPSMRKGFEKALNKYVLDDEWNENAYLTEKISQFGVEMPSPLKILGALQGTDFPAEILKNKNNLLELYQFILDILEFKLRGYNNPSDLFIKKVIEFVRELKIFPMKNEGFTSLGNDENVYFISAQTLEIKSSSENIRLVDPNFTTDESEIDASPDSSDPSKELITTFKRLLMKLMVRELSEETLLTDFVIPELKSMMPFSYEKRMEKFLAVYRSYNERRKQNKDTSKILNGMSDVWLHDKDLKLHQVKDMLIPSSVRLTELENIYDPYYLKEIYLKVEYFERISNEKEMFHDFLIETGIKHKPHFKTIKEIYQNTLEFADKDEERYSIWRNRIKNDYTLANKVVVERVVLDQIDLDIIAQGIVTLEFESKLYADWLIKYKDNEINDFTYYYKGQAIPGYFTVTYIRKEKRCIQLDDIHWAGIDAELVPIKAYCGDLISSSNAFVIPSMKNKQIKYLLDYLDGIAIEDKEFRRATYIVLYAKSLKIRDMTFNDVEHLWNQVDESRFDDIASLMTELINLNISYSSLKLMDKTSRSLRDIKDFRLGQISYDNAPLIEKQYGKLGTVLGTICGLLKDGTIESYKYVIKEILTSPKNEDVVINKFLALLQEWQNYDADEKELIFDEFKSGIGDRKAPFLIFNNSELHIELLQNMIWSISISVDISTSDFENIKKAAKEIGFVLPDSFGELQIRNPYLFRKDESEKCENILQSYISFLEIKEISRLNQKLKLFGGTSQVFRHVVFADSISRKIESANIDCKMDLPYLDEKDRRIILNTSLGYYDVIKSILIMIEFAPCRNIERDIVDIKKSDEKKAHANQINEYFHIALPDSLEINSVKKDSAIIDDYQVQREESRKHERESSIPHLETHSPNKPVSIERPTKELKVTDEIDQVIQKFKEKLKGSSFSEVEVSKEWNLGPNSDDEESIRETLVKEIANSLNNGPEIYRRKLRHLLRPLKTFNGKVLDDNDILTDKDTIDPKAFLEAEYDCRCQICGKQLVFESGRKWTSVYHIQEKKEGAWFYNRPFNFLGLCPNCYAVVKYGGAKDFSQLIVEARNVITGDTFAEPVSDFNGDYYLVDVVLDNQKHKMKVSKIHMSYFAALIQSNDEISLDE